MYPFRLECSVLVAGYIYLVCKIYTLSNFSSLLDVLFTLYLLRMLMICDGWHAVPVNISSRNYVKNDWDVPIKICAFHVDLCTPRDLQLEISEYKCEGSVHKSSTHYGTVCHVNRHYLPPTLCIINISGIVLKFGTDKK